jgi:hypothetical protein
LPERCFVVHGREGIFPTARSGRKNRLSRHAYVTLMGYPVLSEPIHKENNHANSSRFPPNHKQIQTGLRVNTRMKAGKCYSENPDYQPCTAECFTRPFCDDTCESTCVTNFPKIEVACHGIQEAL